MKMFRQGDLLFIKTETLGDSCMETKSKVVLGSSITGHDHEITEGVVYTHEPTWGNNANFYVQVPEGTKLTHPEHGTIPMEEGIYKVIRQREVNGYVED